MSRFMVVGFLVLSWALVLSHGRSASAADLSVATYIELSVARLQLAKDTIELEGRALTAADEEGLWEQAGTTATAYYAFASAHPEKVSGYLDEHPDLQAQIQSLSTRIQTLAAQLDAAPKATARTDTRSTLGSTRVGPGRLDDGSNK